jgi:hypothetical protein
MKSSSMMYVPDFYAYYDFIVSYYYNLFNDVIISLYLLTDYWISDVYLEVYWIILAL